MSLKKCKTCKIELPLCNFTKDKYAKDGVWSKCKSCNKSYNDKRKEYKSNWYQENKEANKERIKKYRLENKERNVKYSKLYYKQNTDYIKACNKNYYQKNKEYILERNKKYDEANKDSVRKLKNKYTKERSKIDPFFKFIRNSRRLIIGAFKRKGIKKNTKTEQILGCTFVEFKAHIETLFGVGMTFENYGKWHIDHIVPLATAKTEEDVLKLNHYTNLQPLWAKDNLSKGSKYVKN